MVMEQSRGILTGRTSASRQHNLIARSLHLPLFTFAPRNQQKTKQNKQNGSVAKYSKSILFLYGVQYTTSFGCRHAGGDPGREQFTEQTL